MQWTFIINPNSGGGRAIKTWPKIKAILIEYGMVFEYHFTSSKGDAIGLASTLANEGKRNFVAVGGDGTLNEVINGLCRLDSIALSEFVIACIPLGSGCDWARGHKIPTNVREAIALLKSPNLFEHDIGVAIYQEKERRYFINVAGIAFDAFVVKQTDKYPKKGIFRHFAYIYGLIRSLTKYIPHAFTYTVNHSQSSGRFFCLNIGICKYSGGGMMAVPKAIPDDNLFDVTVIDHMQPLEVILNISRLFNGKIYEHPKVSHLRTSSIIVKPMDKDILFEVDGELIGNIPVRFETLKERLKVVVPKKS